jgi:YesN/AraC family two-component response regulator
VGENLIKYLSQWKVEQAKVMLVPSGPRPMKCPSTGFRITLFHLLFKKYVGVTPAEEFRDQRSGNGNDRRNEPMRFGRCMSSNGTIR